MNLALISDIVLCSIALLWLVYASISDLKKREVENWIPLSMMFIALIIRGIVSIILGQSILIVLGLIVLFILFFYLFVKEKPIWMQIIGSLVLIAAGILYNSLSSGPVYLSTGFIALGIFFIASLILYYGRVFGGADAKLLMALAFIFATTPSFLNFSYFLPVDFFGVSLCRTSFLMDFITNSLIISLFYGLIFSGIVALRNKKRFSNKFKEVNSKLKWFKIIFLIFGAFILILGIFQKILIIPAILLLILPWFYAFIRSVEQGVLISYKSWDELQEGDWLLEQVRINDKRLKPSADGLSKEDILLIKRAGKKVLIRDGIAYVPVFLLSIIASLLFGNLFLRFLMLIV